MFGSAAGVWVARVTAESPSSQWFVFLALTAAHVLCNVRAVRCLRVDAVNRARARKMVDAWARGEPVPTPREMASREALFAESFADDGIVLGASFSSLDENAREHVLRQSTLLRRWLCHRRRGKGLFLRKRTLFLSKKYYLSAKG